MKCHLIGYMFLDLMEVSPQLSLKSSWLGRDQEKRYTYHDTYRHLQLHAMLGNELQI